MYDCKSVYFHINNLLNIRVSTLWMKMEYGILYTTLFGGTLYNSDLCLVLSFLTCNEYSIAYNILLYHNSGSQPFCICDPINLTNFSCDPTGATKIINRSKFYKKYGFLEIQTTP